MKKLLAALLVIVMMFGLVACGSSTPAATGETTPAAVDTTPAAVTPVVKEAKDLKIALLVPSSPTDGGWGQVGAEAVKVAGDKYGCTISIIEAGTADKMKSEAEALGDEGYDIIFGHGGQYAAPFGEIAANYPDTFFVTAGGNVVSKNQFPVLASAERYAYVEGAIAAKLTKTNKMGCVVGGDFPSYTKTSRGFTLGAQSVNPAIVVTTTVLTVGDMNEAYESTMSQINAGADVVWSNANQATLGSAKAATEKGVYFFGMVSDMSKDAPTVCVASVTQDFKVIYV
ncbi:MAG: BMP family ABC transporter substrate-binding protein, partial [Clostridia bacterium]